MLISKLFILLLCAGITSGFGQENFRIKEGKKKDRIKFEMVNNLIIVPVELNGTQLSFLVDTGVKTTLLLTLNEEDTLLLKSAERIFLRGIGGEELIKAYRSSSNEFRLGNTTSTNLNVYVIYDPDVNFSPRLGVPVHVIIGYDLFKDFVVEVNYPRRFFMLHDPGKFSKKLRKYKEVPLEFFQDKPYVQVGLNIEGKESRATLLLDNGLSDALWLFPDSEMIHVPQNTFSDHLGRGLLGDVVGERSVVEKLTMGEEVLKNVSASFPDSLSVEGLKTYHARNGSMGAEILKRFHVVFDYQNQNLYLRGNKWRNDEFRHNLSGIVLEHKGYQIVESYEEVVRSVSSREESKNEIILEPSLYKKFELKPAFQIARLRPDSPAIKAGLKVGDEVLKINGRNAWKLDLNDFNSLFTSGEGKKIKMQVLRQDRKLEFEFKLRDPLK
jgi:hypothetical protein